MKPIQKISLLAALAAVALCGGSAYADSPKAPIAKHVVLIGVDGFGARWIPWDKMPKWRRGDEARPCEPERLRDPVLRLGRP